MLNLAPTIASAPPRAPELERVAPAAVFAAGLRHHHLANTAYPIAHRRTIWHLRQPEERHPGLLRAGFPPARRMGLYIHIPFCERRCRFCEYCVVDRHTEALERAYHEALLRELGMYVELLGDGAVSGAYLLEPCRPGRRFFRGK